jgi:hypothetical protein
VQVQRVRREMREDFAQAFARASELAVSRQMPTFSLPIVSTM